MRRFQIFTDKPHTSDPSISESSRPILKEVDKKYGFVPNLWRGMAQSPQTLEGYHSLSKRFEESSLTESEQQVVLLTASRMNRSAYGTSVHSLTAETVGLDWETIERIRDREPVRDPRLEALRLFTEAVVKSSGIVPEDVWTEFTEVGFEKPQALDVALGVSLKTLSNSINHLMDTPLDHQFEKRRWSPATSKSVVA